MLASQTPKNKLLDCAILCKNCIVPPYSDTLQEKSAIRCQSNKGSIKHALGFFSAPLLGVASL